MRGTRVAVQMGSRGLDVGGGRRGQGRSLGGLPSRAMAGSPGRLAGWGFSGLALCDDVSICAFLSQLCRRWPALWS